MKPGRTVALLAIVAVLSPLLASPAMAQAGGLVSKDHLYDPGTTWKQIQVAGANGGTVCTWVGREPDGAQVFGWENSSQCTGRVQQWGYDLNADGLPETIMWVRQPVNCPTTTIDAWEWMQNGQWTEYVTGQCIYFPSDRQFHFIYNYWSSSLGAKCPAQARAVKDRYDDSYRKFIAANSTAGISRLQVKIAWHSYNQAWLALDVCRNTATPTSERP